MSAKKHKDLLETYNSDKDISIYEITSYRVRMVMCRKAVEHLWCGSNNKKKHINTYVYV